MKLLELYRQLNDDFGATANPDVWWPIFYGVSAPPAFERVITNVLVQSGSWKPVRAAIEALHRQGLLTAEQLVVADEATLAECIKPTGLQAMKAKRLKAIGACVLERFGTEAVFCNDVTRDELLAITGIGPETADRILLYACGRLAWPVDTYCLRVLARHGVIPQEPKGSAEKRRVVADIKSMVEAELPGAVETWQRLHAMMQLQGERLRRSRE